MSEAEKNVVVLVADDEPSTLALVAAHVRSRGYTVLEASDGDLAWQLAHEHLPDLVVLDVMMPGMSGWEVCRKIREAVSLAHTGVIMLTGIGENLNEMTSPLYGADSYLDKPFEFSVLDQRIAETLAARRKGAMGRPDDAAAAERPNGAPKKASADPPAEPPKRKAASKAAPPPTPKPARAPQAKPAKAKAAAKKKPKAAPKAKAKASSKAKPKKTAKVAAKKAQPKAKAATPKSKAKGRAAAKKPLKKASKKSAPKAKARAVAKKTDAKKPAAKKPAPKPVKRAAKAAVTPQATPGE